MKIYVGNLPFSTNDEDLQALFEAYGEVSSARIIRDWETGRSRGFGFVEMDDHAGAEKAIETLHQSEMGGRSIVVNEARPRPDRMASAR